MRKLEMALKAAADPTRTRILKLLESRDLCVCQIQAVLNIAPSTVSKHLSILKSAELVEDRREGRWIHYGLASASSNAYASGVLSLLRGDLDREPRVVEDRRRLKDVLKVPVADLSVVMPPRRVTAAPALTRRRRSRRERARA